MAKRTLPDFRLGVHTSIAGGISRSVERAVSLRCNTMQIFSHNPRQWHQSHIPVAEAGRFNNLRQKHDISPVFIHASYLINLASLSETILNKSVDLLSYELMNADSLGVEYVILHTGSAREENKNTARKRAIKGILKTLATRRSRACLILENTAGERGDITSTIETLARIIDGCHGDGIGGICIDTCHAFSSGYDITSRKGTDKFISEIEKYLGLDALKLIHVNDSRKPLGAGVDRHEHIGKGFIGTRGFTNLFSDRRIVRVPMILETPKRKEGDDRKNLRKVLNILLKKIRETKFC
jgi:deoxyribonuclease-4